MGQQCPQAKQRMRLPSRCSYRSPSRARESTTSRRVDISALPRILLAVLSFGVAPASCRHVCRAKTPGEMSAYSQGDLGATPFKEEWDVGRDARLSRYLGGARSS